MTFGVDTDTMAASASRIGTAAEQIDELLQQLGTTVNAMLDGWQGGGADAHRELHQRFARDVGVINSGLRSVQDALLQTHSIYVQQENAQSSDHVAMRNQILA